MNEQLAIKRSMQLQSLFGNVGSSKDLLGDEPKVIVCLIDRSAVDYCRLKPINNSIQRCA